MASSRLSAFLFEVRNGVANEVKNILAENNIPNPANPLGVGYVSVAAPNYRNAVMFFSKLK